MKKRYSVILFQRYKDGNKRGYCDHFTGYKTVFVDNWHRGCEGNTRAAKNYSRQLGNEYVGRTSFCETDDLVSGLAAVCVRCEESEKNIIRHTTFEFYQNGEKVKTLVA